MKKDLRATMTREDAAEAMRELAELQGECVPGVRCDKAKGCTMAKHHAPPCRPGEERCWCGAEPWEACDLERHAVLRLVCDICGSRGDMLFLVFYEGRPACGCGACITRTSPEPDTGVFLKGSLEAAMSNIRPKIENLGDVELSAELRLFKCDQGIWSVSIAKIRAPVPGDLRCEVVQTAEGSLAEVVHFESAPSTTVEAPAVVHFESDPERDGTGRD